jgi:sugar phosphate permease
MVFFALAGLTILIPLPLVIFLLRDFPHQQRLVSSDEVAVIDAGSWEKTKEIPKIAGKEDYKRNYRFWLITAAWSLHNIFYWGWGTWMPTYFQTVRHFSFKSAGYAYSLTFLFVLMAALLVGYFSDKAMRRAPFGAVLWIVSGILFFIGGTVVQNAYWALVVLIIAICCSSPAFMMSQTLLQSILPERLMGSAVGAGGGISTLISVASPALIGLMVGISGFGAAIAFLALAPLIAGILMVFLIKEGY